MNTQIEDYGKHPNRMASSRTFVMITLYDDRIMACD